MSGPTSHIFFSQRLRLHYVDWGNSEAPPLLLLHGGMDHCRSWDWVAERLRRDWHILAPDLRGHGDSDWSSDGNYPITGFIYDLSQLIHQQRLTPVSIIAHSFGGAVALRYAGIYPAHVRKIVAIEGLGLSAHWKAARARLGMAERMRRWIDERRAQAGRLPRRYPSLEAAFKRMQEANRHLTPEQALHLTQHGVNQNEDGTYSWKFDNDLRVWSPYDMPQADIEELWRQIDCPVLLLYGTDSFIPSPAEDDRARHFRDVRIVGFERAGHWLHHDRLDDFVETVRSFL
jgi:pimeloyl-ACP methyl ester carboxylesterase